MNIQLISRKRLRMIVRWSGLFALLIVGDVMVAQRIRPIRGFRDRSPTSFLVTVAHRTANHIAPWSASVIQKKQIIGVYLGKNRILVTNLPSGDLLSFTAIEKKNRRRYSAEIIKRDRGLRIGILRMHQPGLLQAYRKERFNFIENPRLLIRLQSAQILRSRKDDFGSRNIVHRHRIKVRLIASTFGKPPGVRTNIPLISFRSQDPNILKGDILHTGSSLVGVVSKFDETRKIGLAIPSHIVAAVLKNGNIDRTNSLVLHPGFQYEPMEGNAFTSYYTLKKNSIGGLITAVLPYSPVYGVLFKGDLILEVNNKKLMPGGFVQDEVYGPIPLDMATILHHGHMRKSGSSLYLRILRRGQIRNLKIGLLPFSLNNFHVPPEFRKPSYLIVGGLVFLELSGLYVRRKKNASVRLQYISKASALRKAADLEHYVVLDRILPHRSNRGYSYNGMLVLAVNDIAIRNIRELQQALQAKSPGKSKRIRFTLEGNREIILNRREIAGSEQEILKMYGIGFSSSISN